MAFLAGLMAITLFGVALPVLFFGFLGVCFLGTAAYKDDFLAWKTFFGILCFCTVGWMFEISWSYFFTRWTVVYVLVWALIGALWFLFKWNKFVGRRRADADSALAVRKQHNPNMTPEEQRLFMLGCRPELDRNKERAIGWVLFWPFSMLAYIFGDLLHDFAEWIIDRLRGMSMRITRRHFGEFESGQPVQGS